MNFIESTGYLAGILVAIALTPQVIKSFTTKKTRDISLLWTSIYIAGLVLWIAYGLLISSLPLVIMTIIELGLGTTLLILKLRYG